MKKYKSAISLVFFVLFVFQPTSVFPSDFDFSSAREFLFEIFRYSVTGISHIHQAAKYSLISKQACNILMIPIWSSNSKPGYLFERFYPEKIGVIQSNFYYKNGVVAKDISLPDSQSYGSKKSKIAEHFSSNEKIEGTAKIDKNGILRRFFYGEESVSFYEIDGVKYVTDLDTSESVLIRRVFDEKTRLVKREKYKTGEKSSDFSLLSDILYFYNEDDAFPFKSQETNLLEDSVIENQYAPNGKTSEQIVSFYEIADDSSADFSSDSVKSDSQTEPKKPNQSMAEKTEFLEPDKLSQTEHEPPVQKEPRESPEPNEPAEFGELNEVEEAKESDETAFQTQIASESVQQSVPIENSAASEKKILVPKQKRFWSYDDQNRVISFEQIEITYSTDKKGNKIACENSVLTKYFYTGAASEPDSDYYENGTLRIRKVHTDSSLYRETLFFDGGIRVVSEYESGNRIYETVYLDGKMLRSRYFEN